MITNGADAGAGPTGISENLVTCSRTRASPEPLFWLELTMFHECCGSETLWDVATIAKGLMMEDSQKECNRGSYH